MINEISKEISSFLESEKFATICCLDHQGAPYCFNCMFLFVSKEGVIYFKSSLNSAHSTYLERDSRIAGTILPVKPDILALKGAQFSGELLGDNDPLYRKAVFKYHFAFPLAVSMPGKVFIVRLNEIKLTDNSVKFGRKFTWERSEALHPVAVI